MRIVLRNFKDAWTGIFRAEEFFIRFFFHFKVKSNLLCVKDAGCLKRSFIHGIIFKHIFSYMYIRVN